MLAWFYKYHDDTMTITPVAVVDDYTSLVFTRSYSGIGTWQMVLPLSSNNVPLVLEADILHLRHKTTGLVTKITKSVSDGNETLTINGIELKGLIRSRIVMPSEGSAYVTYTNRDPAEVVINLISSQLATASEDRKIKGTSLRTTTNDRITYNGRFSSLEEDVEAICTEFGIGYFATLNSLREIKWESYKGVDRRSSQTQNTKMIFSYDSDTLESSTLEIAKNTTNWVLVAGQGEGVERSLASVGDATGFRRVEAYVDARDIEDDSLLEQRGNEKLSEYGDSTVFTARVTDNVINKYRVDFDLGDLCTIIDNFAGQTFKIDARITEITECYEDNSLTLDITFGYDKTGLANIISRLKTDTKALKNKE